ncbi:MAG: hypothetical protein QM703_20035 [Gemmatales bacterium]
MLDGNRFPAICLVLMTAMLPGWSEAQALPHLYYDDLGLISWRTNWPAAQQEARQSGKLIYVQITRFPCKLTQRFCSVSLPNEKLQKSLRKYCVCYVADFHRLPAEVQRLLDMKGYPAEQCPVHVLVSPSLEPLNWATQDVGPDNLAALIEQAAGNRRMQMSKAQDKEVDKLYQPLQSALRSRDAAKIQSVVQSIQKTPGFGEARNKCFDLLDTAEQPARQKLMEAAKLLREQKIPQAQLALDEAKVLSESLPVSFEVDQTLAAMKLYEQALEAERQATTTKQKQQTAAIYQQMLTRYPDTTIGTLAYQKLRATGGVK